MRNDDERNGKCRANVLSDVSSVTSFKSPIVNGIHESAAVSFLLNVRRVLPVHFTISWNVRNVLV